MQTIRTKPFRSGNSQAVRLPKGFDFEDGVELELTREGNVVTIRPVKLTPAELIEALNRLPRPTEIEVRDTEEIPEPKGL